MLNWLKEILGETYSEEIGERISAEVGRCFVAKKDFNATKEELRRLRGEMEKAGEEMETLRAAAADRDTLRAAAAAQEQTILRLREEAENMRKTAVVRDSLRALGATDPDYIIYKQGGIEAFAFDAQGNPEQIRQIAADCKRNPATAFLFAGERGGYAPAGDAGYDCNPFAKETFNLTEQGRLFREDPAAARQMAAAAKIKI